MKQHPPSDPLYQNLQQKIELVKWQNIDKTQKFNLLTVHSLIVDDNPKFIQLKSLIHNYNQTPYYKLDRQNLRTSFIAKLYKLLCQLVRIPIMENQLSFLDKIYLWASSNKTVLQNAQQKLQQYQNYDNNLPNQAKNRPTTASTKTRPFSAYSRPYSAVSKGLNSKKMTIQLIDHQQYINQLNKQLQTVDYQKLQLGERQFYDGSRTRHPLYQHPKKRLKQYRRKVYYDQIDKDDSDQQIKQQQQVLKDFPAYDMKKYQQKQEEIVEQQLKQGQQQKQGQQALDLIGGQQDLNVDDIPLDVDDQQQPQQEAQKVDKLKPFVKVFNDFKESHQIHKKQYHHGNQIISNQKARILRHDQEDREIAKMVTQWGNIKASRKTQTNRRAQSARMITQKLGIKAKTIEKPVEKIQQNANVINLTLNKQFQVKSNSRPRTAFQAKNQKIMKQNIAEAMLTGKLSSHVTSVKQEATEKLRPISSYAPAPKKKTFQQILFQAEQKVRNDAQQQIMMVKNILAKNKINISANKIAKSISCTEPQLPGGDDFVGQITGTGMYKNPFFKVAKKKKKKKKK